MNSHKLDMITIKTFLVNSIERLMTYFIARKLYIVA